MTTEKIAHVIAMLEEHRRTTGRDPRVGHSVIVDPGGAMTLMREIFMGSHFVDHRVDQTRDPDELFRVDRVPVRLRFGAPFGTAWIVFDEEFPARERRCCDATSMATLMMAMSRGQA